MVIEKIIEMSGDILECLHDGVAIVDLDGTVVYVNDANFRITGVAKNALLGKKVEDMVPDSHIPYVLSTGNKLIGVKTVVNSKQVISNIVPIIIDGRMEGVISIFRDISEVLALNNKLQEANSTIEHLYKKLNFIKDIDSNLIVGKSHAMDQVLKLIQKASQVNSTVLLQGESGTGKEVFARFIHSHSPRTDKPFIPVNCAAIPETLLESELFGYEEGAFTGAKKGGRPGVFELAHEGTIFLDEIGDMSFALQAKLLRVLQDKEITRVGGVRFRRVDVRVIAASNRDLAEMVGEKLFREDLYYRLGVIKIQLPPLRSRKEDVHLYVENAVKKISIRINKIITSISPKAMRVLFNYEYPGNIRELENIIEMAIVTDEDGIIDLNDLPSEIARHSDDFNARGDNSFSLQFDHFPTMEELEACVFSNCVKRLKSKTEIAKILNISRSTLYRKLEQYGLLHDVTE